MGRLAVGLALAVALAGCASNSITIPGEYPITVEQSLYSRGCLAMDYEPTTQRVSVVIQQDGTSDFSVFRLVDSVADMAAGVFGGERRGQGMQGPTIGGGPCESIFQQAPPPPGNEESEKPGE